MAVTTLTQQGAFTADLEKQINDNFTALVNTAAGGTLTSAHLLVGNGSNLATDVAVSGDATLANTGALTVVSVGGTKYASGITALDGSNPTTVTTGLTTITGLALTLDRSTAVSSGTAFVSYHNIVAGAFDMYAWVLAGSASTGTENVGWVAVGT